MSRNNSQQGKTDKIVSLCKRRGFIFQSSEIYGGLNSCWDYGPLGVELKRHVKNYWWQEVVISREDVVGMDSSIIMHPRVWEASGHVVNFHDPLVDCKRCKRRFREDELEDKSHCPVCGGELTPPRQFNLMFKTHFGPSEESSAIVYLRPETAQGIFVNFDKVITTARGKLPFGIGQIGKAFRNEIVARNFIFRSREFEQMELEYFVHPEESDRYLSEWTERRLNWYKELGITPEKLRIRPHGEEELAHYARACNDIEYQFSFGWGELEGIADRGTYDLDKHIEYSGKKLTYFDPMLNKHIVPAVVEASAGVDRTIFALLDDAYWEDQENDRVVLRFSPRVAPIKVGVFPLVKKAEMVELARKIFNDLRKSMAAFYDDGGAIGRRYRRQDEAGTPFCVTVDGQSLEDNTVTIRDRDSLKQIRVAADQVKGYIQERIW